MPSVKKEAKTESAFCRAVMSQRRALGLSQSEVARLAGITQSSYHLIEKGATKPTEPTMLRICDALGLAMEFRVIE